MKLSATRHERIRFIQKKKGVEMLRDFENDFKL